MFTAQCGFFRQLPLVRGCVRRDDSAGPAFFSTVSGNEGPQPQTIPRSKNKKSRTVLVATARDCRLGGHMYH